MNLLIESISEVDISCFVTQDDIDNSITNKVDIDYLNLKLWAVMIVHLWMNHMKQCEALFFVGQFRS